VSTNSQRLIVIAKLRPFDEATWKRLLVAYAYALYDQRKQRADKTAETSEGAAQ
jgi:hypothetical protein